MQKTKELTSLGLTKTGNFLKPYLFELFDTIVYMTYGLVRFIISLLPKKQMIYSWRWKRVIPNIKKYFLLILILYFAIHLLVSVVKANETYDIVKGYEPKKVDDQYCYVKVEIKQIGNDIIKQEILECADGRRGINTPGYWELFAQFYYRDISAPEYCRYYSRPNHVFKTFGKTCLNKNGEWEVK